MSKAVKKRTTKKQTKANRTNAKKSTGPRTAEGKARVRLNAVKHGLRAEQVVVLGGPTAEDPAEFDSLLSGMLHDCKPAGALERVLVERLAVSYWRLRRAYRFEARAIERANEPNPMSKMLEEFSQLPLNKPGLQELPGLRSLDKLVRYELMIDRELLRTATQLQHLQHVRKLEEEDAVPEPTASGPGPSADPHGSGPQPEGCGSVGRRQIHAPAPAGGSRPDGRATALEQCSSRTRAPLKSGGTRVAQSTQRQTPPKLSGRTKPFGRKTEACTGLRAATYPVRAGRRHRRAVGEGWRGRYDISPVGRVKGSGAKGQCDPGSVLSTQFSVLPRRRGAYACLI